MMIYQNTRLTIFQSDLYQTNACLFDGGDFLLIVDPNWLPREVAAIRSFVDEHYPHHPQYLLFTHADYDHILGASAFPHAKVIASQRFANYPRKKEVLEEIRKFDASLYVERSGALYFPEVTIVIEEDGQQLTLGDFKLTFYLAPGHTAEGIFTIIEEAGIWLAGDYLSAVEFPFVYHSSEAYLKTLTKIDLILQKHPIQLMLPGHGPMAKDNTAEILIRRDRDRAYLHKLRAGEIGGEPADFEEFAKEYPFPSALYAEHLKNLELIKNEFGGSLEEKGE